MQKEACCTDPSLEYTTDHVGDIWSLVNNTYLERTFDNDVRSGQPGGHRPTSFQ